MLNSLIATMSWFEPSAVREAATVATRAMGYKGMKPEQLKVVEKFVRGNGVFVYAMPAYLYYLIIYRRLPKPAGFSIVLVVSPLVALRAKRLFTYLCLMIFIE